jgi:thioredoxin-like negative regulator of GroEL
MRQDGDMKQPQGFSIAGAVDLGARRSAVQRRQQTAQQAAQALAGAASAAGGSGSSGDSGNEAVGVIIDVTDETFNDEVVARSQTVPVVVDVWADWCGPCKQLSPLLEKLATEANGAWVLAKVDFDANPQIAGSLQQAFQAQSIPMVAAVIGGQLADGFLGALPEAQLRAWIGQVMQVAQELGLNPAAAAAPGQQDLPGGPDAPPGDPLYDPAYAQAQEAMERGDLDAAAAAFQKVLDAEPAHQFATMGLRQVELLQRVSSYDQAAARRDVEERPDDVDAQARVADIDLAMGRIDASFARLLDAVRQTSGTDRDKARRHLLSLFEIFPPKDSRVTKARATLSSLLF